MKNKTYIRKKIVVTFFLCAAAFLMLIGRLVYLMVGCSEHYTEAAKDLHERERSIKAARGGSSIPQGPCWRITGRYARYP